MLTFFPREEYEARWRALDAAMAEQGFDVAVIWGRSGGTYERHGDVLYLVNFYSSQSGQVPDTFYEGLMGAAFSAVIVKRGETPELIADEPWHDDRVMTDRVSWHRNTTDATAKALVRRGIKGRVALVGANFLPVRYARLLESATPGIEWIEADTLVSDLRVIKSPRELDAFRIAGETATVALTALIEGLLAGQSEHEAAGAAAREIVRRGGHPHMIPVCHGDRLGYFTSDPVTAHSDTRPRQGDIVRGWVYGPMFQGYWLDPGRSTVVGLKPSNARRHLVESTADIVEKCRAMIRPGVAVRDIAALGERLTKEFGGTKDQAAEKWPLYGHGVGLFWDEPLISSGYPGKHTIVKENMVMSTEAFLAMAGVGAAGFEQNFIVTRDGTELLTRSPMSWW
jgi:Xaa-Pro aminopeptidase